MMAALVSADGRGIESRLGSRGGGTRAAASGDGRRIRSAAGQAEFIRLRSESAGMPFERWLPAGFGAVLDQPFRRLPGSGTDVLREISERVCKLRGLAAFPAVDMHSGLLGVPAGIQYSVPSIQYRNSSRCDLADPDCGAQKRTRTSTPLPALGPEPSASTNSAIWARKRAASLMTSKDLSNSDQLN